MSRTARWPTELLPPAGSVTLLHSIRPRPSALILRADYCDSRLLRLRPSNQLSFRPRISFNLASKPGLCADLDVGSVF